MKSRIILIDFENVTDIDLTPIEDLPFELKIFVNQHKSSIQLPLVQKLQKYGNQIEWIRIAGDGHNALDFHIAYYLGKYHEKRDAEIEFVIVSKDKGFDPLVTYLTTHENYNCRRVDKL